jgi:hypothetical protein
MAATSLYYFMDDVRKILYFSEEFSTDPDLIYVGTSNNPKPKSAAASFVQDNKISSGFKIQRLK